MKCRLRFIVCCLSYVIIGLQLNGQIRGVVVNEADEPLEGIVVAALATADSTYIDGTVTDSIGAFAVPVRGDIQNLILRLEGIGYEPKAVTVSAGENVRVALQSRELTLGEVSVEAPQLQFSKGRFMFYPGNLTEYATDGFNLLQYVPLLVTNRINNSLSIIGKKQTKILVNGREPVGGEYAIIKLLQVADPKRIKKVEIITEPSIGRQEQGSIVNIVLAPQTGNILTADVYGLLRNGRVSSRQQVFYFGEYNRWQFSASINANEGNSRTLRESYYEFLPTDDSEGSSQITRYSEDKRDTWLGASFGASLDLLHNNSFGINVSYNWMHRRTDTHTVVEYQPWDFVENLTSYYKEPHTEFANISVNYDHNLDSLGNKFWADANLFINNNDQQTTYSPGASMNARRTPLRQRSVKMTAQWDKELGESFSLVIGTKGYYDWQGIKKFESRTESLQGSQSLADDFRYIQSQADVYASMSYSGGFGTIRAGLTGRFYHRDVNQKVHAAEHGFSRYYALPSATVSLPINSNHYITLGYNMELEHPYYYLVNPIEDWSRQTAYFSGNPNLKSVKKNTLSLTYVLYRHIIAGGTTEFRSNVSQVVSIPEPGGIIHSMPLETGRANETQVFASYNNSFFNYRLTIAGSVNWKYRHYTPSTEYQQYTNGQDNSSQWAFSFSGRLALGKDRDWTLSASLYSESPLHQPFYNAGWNNMLGVYASKSFEDAISVTLQVDNILDSSPRTWNYSSAYRSSSRKINCERSIMLRVDITIGKSFRRRTIGTSGGMGGI